MKWAAPGRRLLYIERRDIGKRTCLNCREHTPELHRSVPLPAPRRVALSGARVGRAYIAPAPRCLVHLPERREEAAAMPVVYPVCCGLEVHQAQRTACLRQGDGAGHVTQEVGSVVPRRARCSPCWRGSWHRTVRSWPWKVPGVHWQPISHVLEAGQWTSWWAIRMRGGAARGARQTRPMRGGSRSCLPMASFARALSRLLSAIMVSAPMT